MSPTAYHLACHCQRNVLLYTPADAAAPFSGATICACSHCAKRRAVWVFADRGAVRAVRGGAVKEGELSVHKFASGKLPHYFCGHCGTHIISGGWEAGEGMVGINIRAIRDESFDLWSLTLAITPAPPNAPGDPHAYDRAPPPAEAEAYLVERAKHYDYETRVYNGSCHCKAVAFSMLCRPIEEVLVKDCNCSICLGNGALWIYPGRHDVVFHPSQPGNLHDPRADLVSRYVFSDARVPNEHVVCKACGCQVFESREARGVEGFEGWEEDEGRVVQGDKRSMGVNAAMLDVFQEYYEGMGRGGGGDSAEGSGGGAEGGGGRLKGYERGDAMRGIGGVYQVRV